MELCKICAIILVLLVHSVFPITGRPLSTSDSNVPALFWSALSIIGVNVFVLVTGYFSTVPKKKSVLNILFVCFFYAGSHDGRSQALSHMPWPENRNKDL